MILNLGGGDGFRRKLPEFTYSGQYELKDDGISNDVQNWRIRLLTNGVLTFASLGSGKTGLDVFCVGGGGGGGGNSQNGNPGGGGGYTRTALGVEAQQNRSYSIVIGAGGAAEQRGGTTSALGVEAEGGYGGNSAGNRVGGNGGSGGGASDGGAGGSNGGNGGVNVSGGGSPGTGQGNTTREFGESGGALYAGGGGGGELTGFSGCGIPGSGGSGIVVIRNGRT